MGAIVDHFWYWKIPIMTQILEALKNGLMGGDLSQCTSHLQNCLFKIEIRRCTLINYYNSQHQHDFNEARLDINAKGFWVAFQTYRPQRNTHTQYSNIPIGSGT